MAISNCDWVINNYLSQASHLSMVLLDFISYAIKFKTTKRVMIGTWLVVCIRITWIAFCLPNKLHLYHSNERQGRVKLFQVCNKIIFSRFLSYTFTESLVGNIKNFSNSVISIQTKSNVSHRYYFCFYCLQPLFYLKCVLLPYFSLI